MRPRSTTAYGLVDTDLELLAEDGHECEFVIGRVCTPDHDTTGAGVSVYVCPACRLYVETSMARHAGGSEFHALELAGHPSTLPLQLELELEPVLEEAMA